MENNKTLRWFIILLLLQLCSCSCWSLKMPDAQLQNLYSVPPECTKIAIRNAFTFLERGYPTLIAVGPTKKKDVGHAQALALKNGRMVPIVNTHGNIAMLSERGDLDDVGDPMMLGRSYLLSPREAIKKWYPTHGGD